MTTCKNILCTYLLGSFSCQASIETQITTIGPRYRETVTRERYDDNLLYVFLFLSYINIFLFRDDISLSLFFSMTTINIFVTCSFKKYYLVVKYHVYRYQLFPRFHWYLYTKLWIYLIDDVGSKLSGAII